MTDALKTLGANGLEKFQTLQDQAAHAVTARFYAAFASVYENFGERGRQATRQDLLFHLEFLRPVLEFGLAQSMVDYLRWLDSVLVARRVPSDHLALSLDWLAEFFAEHMEHDDGAVVASALYKVREMYLATIAEPVQVAKPPEPWPEAAEFEAALLSGNHVAALSQINGAIDKGHSLIDFELHVIQPALYEIGSKWQMNRVSVAKEHLATAIAQSAMTVGLLRARSAASIGKRVLLACVEGNQHAVGLRMVADAFLLEGWDVQYLGPNVPTRSLVQQVGEWKPDLLGLSASFPQQIRVAKEIVESLRQKFGNTSPAVIVGGLAINQFNLLADVVGADAWSPDAGQAVARAGQIVAARGLNDTV
jgi:methanogenic corrinoid protein MtbC1